MKKLFLISVLVGVSMSLFSQVKNYQVWATKELKATGYSLFNGDTLRFINSQNGEIIRRVNGVWKNNPDTINIPYVGAIKDVDLDTVTIRTNSVKFNQNPNVNGIVPGELFWDVDNRTLSFFIDDGGIIQVGQEPHDYYTNLEGAAIVNGDIVSICGASGNRTAVCLTDAANDEKALSTVGMVTVTTIGNNNVGRITKNGGKVRGINTIAYAEGTVLYVHPTIKGKWTSTMPQAPTRAIRIGTVSVSHAVNGVVELDIQVMPKMSELADVNGTPLNASGQFAVWNETNKYFDFTENINDYKHIQYCPATMTVNKGTLNTGSVSNLCAIGGTDVNIQEVTGADPLRVTFTFTGVQRLTSFTFYGDYNGGASHIIWVEAYNYTTLVWDFIGQFSSSTTKQWYDFELFLPNRYLSSGNVQVRLNHQGTGISTHSLVLDYVDINYGGGGGATSVGASSISFNPAGNVSATNVQSAIQELDSEKQSQLNGTGFVKASGTTISYDNSTYLKTSTDTLYTTIPISDEATPLTVGTAKRTFRMPVGCTLTKVIASVTTAPTGSTLIFDINENGVFVLSTKLSIDDSEKVSVTAASQAVISDSSILNYSEITIDIDQVGATVAGAGAKIILYYLKN